VNWKVTLSVLQEHPPKGELLNELKHPDPVTRETDSADNLNKYLEMALGTSQHTTSLEQEHNFR